MGEEVSWSECMAGIRKASIEDISAADKVTYSTYFTMHTYARGTGLSLRA